MSSELPSRAPLSEPSCEVVRTEHGVLAMRDASTGEVMHPGIGPRAEATALYVGPSRLAARLAEPSSVPLVLYDVGLGAGSNAIAAFATATSSPAARPLHIVSFERTLAPLRLALTPQHAEAFGFGPAEAHAAATLLSTGRYASEQVVWQLALGELAVHLTDSSIPSADIVFWDPYSPRANPECWSVAAFRALHAACRPGATVHTYSAATATRTALLLAGFYVGLGVGSGPKQRPTTIAARDAGDLDAPLGPSFFAQLATSRIPFPLDAPEDARARLATHPQARAASAAR
jgi:queuine tRNA-ribosyltransferase